MQEKRADRRSGIGITVEIKARENPSPIVALRPNISWGGIGFFTTENIQLGTPVDVTFSFLDQSENRVPETISGAVRWIKQMGNFYGVGVTFGKIRQEEYPHLYNYLRSSDQYE